MDVLCSGVGQSLLQRRVVRHLIAASGEAPQAQGRVDGRVQTAIGPLGQGQRLFQQRPAQLRQDAGAVGVELRHVAGGLGDGQLCLRLPEHGRQRLHVLLRLPAPDLQIHYRIHGKQVGLVGAACCAAAAQQQCQQQNQTYFFQEFTCFPFFTPILTELLRSVNVLRSDSAKSGIESPGNLSYNGARTFGGTQHEFDSGYL